MKTHTQREELLQRYEYLRRACLRHGNLHSDSPEKCAEVTALTGWKVDYTMFVALKLADDMNDCIKEIWDYRNAADPLTEGRMDLEEYAKYYDKPFSSFIPANGTSIVKIKSRSRRNMKYWYIFIFVALVLLCIWGGIEFYDQFPINNGSISTEQTLQQNSVR